MALTPATAAGLADAAGPLPPALGLSGEQPGPAELGDGAGRDGPGAALQCGDCGRFIPALDSHG
eukprot:2902083-Alexandrium_andersonii.AAC.1